MPTNKLENHKYIKIFIIIMHKHPIIIILTFCKLNRISLRYSRAIQLHQKYRKEIESSKFKLKEKY